MKKTTRSFVTGSYAYGEPTEGSDIDLVILCTTNDFGRLKKQADKSLESADAHYGDRGSISLRFGKLNLLCCIREDWYEAWKEGTKKLKAKRPVSRDTAMKVMDEVRVKMGLIPKPKKIVSDPTPRNDDDIPF